MMSNKVRTEFLLNLYSYFQYSVERPHHGNTQTFGYLTVCMDQGVCI